MSNLVLCTVLIHCIIDQKQLYMSNKMEYFSYKGGCGIRECTLIKAFIKEKLAWAIDKWLWVISNKMLFKAVIPLRN